MPVSRRQFLQLTGIALLNGGAPFPALPARAQSFGRTLLAAPLRRAPHASAEVVGRLWPDSITPITILNGGWYRTPGGYVEKIHLQPIVLSDAQPKPPTPQPPFWAEVTAPVAVIRQWCAADAPLITRIGHGGVARIIDRLPGDPLWYGIADLTGALLGWSQASAWQPISDQARPARLDVTVHQRSQRITVLADDECLLEAPVSTSQKLPPGVYAIERGAVGGQRCPAGAQGDYHGVPWQLNFGDHQAVHGVYWHNRFGEGMPGPAVQVTPYVARGLYALCGPGSRLRIENA